MKDYKDCNSFSVNSEKGKVWQKLANQRLDVQRQIMDTTEEDKPKIREALKVVNDAINELF